MTPYSDLPCTDLLPQQEAIRETYGDRWFASDDAMAEAGALWGITSQHDVVNECGVFIEPEEVMLAQCGRSYALAQLVHAPNGLWAVSVSYQLPLRGYHALVSVWNRRAFPSRDATRRVAQQSTTLSIGFPKAGRGIPTRYWLGWRPRKPRNCCSSK